MSVPSAPNLAGRLLAAVLTLLVVAAGARLVWDLLRPLLGMLVVLAAVLAVVTLLLRRRRWW